jgi:hypothetical protein
MPFVLRKMGLAGLIIIIVLMLSLPSLVRAQNGTAELGVFDTYQVAPGEVVQLPVSVRNVQDLYGLDFILKFDPALVQVEDADPSRPGIQAVLGSFLDPGLLLFNTGDNNAGTFHFAMSQYNPSQPKSGAGIVLVITFRGVAEGESPLTIIKLQLASGEAIEIPSTGIDSTLRVERGAPTQAATFAATESTTVIIVGAFTLTPTSTPVSAVTEDALTNTPVPGDTGGPAIKPPGSKNTEIAPTEPPGSIDTEAAPVSAPAAGQEAGEENVHASVPFLAQYWWMLLILAVLAAAGSVYLFVLKRKNCSKQSRTP